MRTANRLLIGIVLLVSSLVVVTCSVYVVGALVRSWGRGLADGDPVVYWVVVGAASLALLSPWAASAHALTGRGARGLAGVACAALGYAAAVAVLGLRAWHVMRPEPTAGLMALVLIPAFLGLGLGLTARPWPRRVALVAGAAVAIAVVWLTWRHQETFARLEGWAWANRPLGALLAAGAVLAGLLWAAAVLGVLRRWAIAASLAVSIAVWPVCWFVWMAPEAPAVGLDRIELWDRMPIPPSGPFADAAGPGVLGWARVRSWIDWRESLLLQPPCTTTGEVRVRRDGTVRLWLTLPAQRIYFDDLSVEVRCRLDDAAGTVVGREKAVLRVGSATRRSASWQEVVFTTSLAPGRALAFTLEVQPLGSAEGEQRAPVVAVAHPPETSPDTGPNCVIVLIDALRADRLHCYGCPKETSPRIDRLAQEGALFERAISACSYTVPSVASLFTGTYLSTHGVVEYYVPMTLGFPTLADRFREAGAYTAAISGNMTVAPDAGFGAGFIEYIGGTGVEAENNNDMPPADWVTDHAIRMLRRVNGRRFFLYLHYMDPHAPYTPPRAWTRFGWTDEERYLGEVLYCDSQVGRLLDELTALGRRDDTLVIVIADHGEAFNEHGWRRHGNTLHREEVQVPLILRWPGRVPAGRRVAGAVRAMDIFPTLLEMFDLGTPGRHVEATSLAPLLRGDSGPGREIFSELPYPLSADPRPWVALEEGRYKLVRHGADPQRLMLFDIRADPQEQVDLLEGQPAIADRMAKRIDRFLADRRPFTAPQDTYLREEAERRLRALGYLDPGE